MGTADSLQHLAPERSINECATVAPHVYSLIFSYSVIRVSDYGNGPSSQSDVPAVAYAACRLLCMGSARSPTVTMREHLDVCVGFLDYAVPEVSRHPEVNI